MRVGRFVVAALAAVSCTPSGGTLELTPKKSRIFDDGETTEIKIKATDLQGRVGTGRVRFAADAGVFGDNPVQLDAYGTGVTTFSCDVVADRGCVGTVAFTGEWNGVTTELSVRMNERCPGAFRCGGECAVLATSWHHCGACGAQCTPTQKCEAGACVPCTGDCDSDGWAIADGDCCDQYNVCTRPASVNPGAVEGLGNGIDDNCNGLLDQADVLDVEPCDGALDSRPGSSLDYAKAIGLCRTTTEGERTWGVLSAEIVHANGVGGVTPNRHSIRPVFGTIPPQEGARVAVFGSGVASDAVQSNPSLGDGAPGSEVDLSTCDAGGCITDWFSSNRPGVKAAFKLPSSPMCGGESDQKKANDSVMLRLRIRAPTNAQSFRLKTRFFSEEYPEFVCSSFNDQMILLIDTPGASVGNPPDKNLMTYATDGGSWPVGINLAAGTPLFQTCQSKASAPMCWDTSVNVNSCGQGPGELANTQYSAGGAMGCVRGGGTIWMGTRGNVKPGQIFELRAAVWDVGDHALDSLVLIDDFEWSVDVVEPGTGE